MNSEWTRRATPDGNDALAALASILAVAGLSLGLVGCGDPDGGSGGAARTDDAGWGDATLAPPLSSLDSLSSPAGPDSGEPNLVAGPDAVYLTWLERVEPDRHALRFARWDGTGWGETRTVIERENLFVNWADFPSLAVLDDGTLAAHWLEKSGPGTYAYDVRMALSHDGGASWGPDIIPHRDGVEAEHGFVSLLPLDGGLGVAWLDGRETVDGKPMTVRFTTVSADGELGPETALDTSTCDCCQTALARTDAGPILAYRDRDADEVRDIYVARRVDGAWTEGAPVHDDGWVIPGCPVNGPALAADGFRLAVAWFTGAPLDRDAEGAAIRAAGERGRVLAAFSDDAGASFGEPVRVDDGAAMGRVDLVLLDDGSTLVAWLERVEGSAEVRVRRVSSAGVGPARTVTGTAAQRTSGFPRMTRWRDRIVLAWTEPGTTPRVRLAVGRLNHDEDTE